MANNSFVVVRAAVAIMVAAVAPATSAEALRPPPAPAPPLTQNVYIGPAPCDVLLDAARTWLDVHRPRVGDSLTDLLPGVGECWAAEPGTGHVSQAGIDAIAVPGEAATHTVEKAGQGTAATQAGPLANVATTRGHKVRAGATTTHPKTLAGRRDGVVRDGRHHSSPSIANTNTASSEPSHGVGSHTAREPDAGRDRNVDVDDEGGMSEAAVSSPAPPPVAHSGMPEVSTNLAVSNSTSPSSDGWAKNGRLERDGEASGTRQGVASRFAAPLRTAANDASWDSRRIVDARDDFDGTSVSNVVEQDANTRDAASNEHDQRMIVAPMGRRMSDDVRAIAAPSPTATSKASSSDLLVCLETLDSIMLVGFLSLEQFLWCVGFTLITDILPCLALKSSFL